VIQRMTRERARTWRVFEAARRPLLRASREEERRIKASYAIQLDAAKAVYAEAQRAYLLSRDRLLAEQAEMLADEAERLLSAIKALPEWQALGGAPAAPESIDAGHLRLLESIT